MGIIMLLLCVVGLIHQLRKMHKENLMYHSPYSETLLNDLYEHSDS
jgi:hypothetical protein